MASVELSRISKAFGDTSVLNGIDLSIRDGEFLTLVAMLPAPDRLVNTEIYEGAPEGLGVITTTFTEKGGRTTMSQLCEYGDRKVRDAVIDSGMEGGMQESLDELEKVAASLH